MLFKNMHHMRRFLKSEGVSKEKKFFISSGNTMQFEFCGCWDVVWFSLEDSLILKTQNVVHYSTIQTEPLIVLK